jgi:hypothetical protein
MASTFHTYSELITDSGRHARTDWNRATATDAVAATIRHDSAAVISSATDSTGLALFGLLPGGLG